MYIFGHGADYGTVCIGMTLAGAAILLSALLIWRRRRQKT
ncbi:LPXTG cell wall anchor domain-containing protein [Ectobacillus ponti]|uniref:LPXTG cell wall anchor domain-containing protein n=1 Tax=Ectobacillus ponti TaxID=2961894 RepID=A0AA41XCD3_9BACI|nr:LPXTG cell wall anchor domain-containing protein [Ectobacillus ponti]MCP8970744.1 LPXTG cell wall anchor domain-containing protein [Ectobacillus ponti]